MVTLGLQKMYIRLYSKLVVIPQPGTKSYEKKGKMNIQSDKQRAMLGTIVYKSI